MWSPDSPVAFVLSILCTKAVMCFKGSSGLVLSGCIKVSEDFVIAVSLFFLTCFLRFVDAWQSHLGCIPSITKIWDFAWIVMNSVLRGLKLENAPRILNTC